MNLICFWSWEIPVAWMLAHHFELGPNGIFIAMTTAFGSIAVLSTLIFRRGRWKGAVV